MLLSFCLSHDVSPAPGAMIRCLAALRLVIVQSKRGETLTRKILIGHAAGWRTSSRQELSHGSQIKACSLWAQGRSLVGSSVAGLPGRLKDISAVLQHLPFYRIFAADARAPRDGRHLEVVGHYDPLPGQNELGLLIKVVRSAFAKRSEATINNQLAAGKDGNKHITLDIDRIK